MTRRGLVRSGGFVNAAAFPGDASGASCAVCHGLLDVEGGWVAVATQDVICARCLPSPEAGEAGERMAARLAALRQEETRREQGAWPLGPPPLHLSADAFTNDE